jgi:transglutaminase-like putative cysteine protease
MDVQRRQLTLTAAAATLLAALPLGTVFAQWTWLLLSGVAVATLCGVGALLRGFRLPFWLPSLVMIAVFPSVLGMLFPGSQSRLSSAVPSLAMLRHFDGLLVAAGADMRRLSSPAPDQLSLLFLSTLGIGAIAILVDLFAVVLRRPALAGLPMLAVYSVPVAIERDSVSLLPFALGALGFLWLLVVDSVDRVRRFGRRFSGDGRDVDAWAPSPLAAAGQRLGLVGVVLAIVLPLALPGMNSGLLEQVRKGGIGGSGAGSGPGIQLYAMLSGNLQRDKTFKMVKVRTNDPSPYYLRFAMADRLTPHGFVERRVTGGVTATGQLPGPPQAAAWSGSNQTYHASVEILKLDSSFLPNYQYPTRFQGIGPSWRYEQESGTVRSSQDNTRGKRYSFDYVRPEYAADDLRNALPIESSSPALSESLYVPRVPQVEALVTELTAGTRNQYDKVMAIFKHFSKENGFSYALSTKESTGGAEIVSFLENKQGFCVQYSAAMAWLVRQARYPARVAFGFTRGTTSPEGVATLTNFNLHAWTEVYFNGYGWVPFDPTPAIGVAGSVSPDWAPNPSQQDQPAIPAPQDSASGAGPQVSASTPLGNSSHESGQQDLTGSGSSPALPIWPIWAGLGILATLALCGIPTWRRRALRRRRMRPHGPPPPGGNDPETARSEREVIAERTRAHAAWDELVDTITDYGLTLDSAESPRATAARMARTERLGQSAVAGVQTLGHAEERARYARQPAASDHDLVAALTAVRQDLRANASLRVRFRAALLPPSVLTRWRARLARVTSRATTAVVERGETMARAARTIRVGAGRARG